MSDKEVVPANRPWSLKMAHVGTTLMMVVICQVFIRTVVASFGVDWSYWVGESFLWFITLRRMLEVIFDLRVVKTNTKSQ